MSEMKKALGADEVAEIEKHKYFLSEKAGHDVGWEFAEKDWRETYRIAPAVTQIRRDDPESRSAPRGFAARLKRLFSRAKAASH